MDRFIGGVLAAVFLATLGCDDGGDLDVVGAGSSPLIQYAPQQTITTTSTQTRHYVGALLFSAVSGAKYRLRSKIELVGNSQKSYVQAFTYCDDENDTTVELITHQQNVLGPNGSLTLYPRLIWQAPNTGVHTCYAGFDIEAPTPGTVILTSQSYVENTGPLHPGSQDVREDIAWLLTSNQAKDVAVDDDFTIPDLNKAIAISGDVLWTLCMRSDRSEAPGEPPETPCPRADGVVGNLLYTVAVFQRGPAGQEWCSQWTDSKTATIGADVHHATSYGGGTFVPNPSCGTSARLKIYVKNTGADPIAIHRRGTIMAAIPSL